MFCVGHDFSRAVKSHSYEGFSPCAFVFLPGADFSSALGRRFCLSSVYGIRFAGI